MVMEKIAKSLKDIKGKDLLKGPLLSWARRYERNFKPNQVRFELTCLDDIRLGAKGIRISFFRLDKEGRLLLDGVGEAELPNENILKFFNNGKDI
jgi:hypothetical protein